MKILLIVWSVISIILEAKYLFKSEKSKSRETVLNAYRVIENKNKMTELQFELTLAIGFIISILFSATRILLSLVLIKNSYFLYFSLFVLIFNGVFLTSLSNVYHSNLHDDDNTNILANHLILKDVYSIVYITYGIITIFLLGGV